MKFLKPCDRCKRNLTDKKYCEDCEAIVAKQNKRSRTDNREPASKRGYDRDWKKLRDYKLLIDPLCECENCKKYEVIKQADVVHHIKPVAEYPELRLSLNNLMSMSRECHEILHGRKWLNPWQQGRGG